MMKSLPLNRGYSIGLTDKTHDELKEYCNQYNVPMTYAVDEIIKEYLDYIKSETFK